MEEWQSPCVSLPSMSFHTELRLFYLLLLLLLIAITLQVLGRDCEANTDQVSDLKATIPAPSLSSDGLVGHEAVQGLLWVFPLPFPDFSLISAPVWGWP